MPNEDSKKHDKKKNDPKEQRRPRQRHQQGAADRKSDKKVEASHTETKVTVPQKPVYESPPPEFYKNLKRETDEILKITEEESSKYKKKEIQSNWSKYEVPIETYDEIEEHENLGADYEKLIQAPLSIGGHFQFKHEKSWDMNTGPSLYDKYFDINMEDLNLALCTIPFYERNSIEGNHFSQTDILTMNNRSTRFKQKYYNDKSYSTPETEAQDKILDSLRESMKDDVSGKDANNDIQIKCDNNIIMHATTPDTENKPVLSPDINLEFKTESKTESTIVNKNIKETTIRQENNDLFKPNIDNLVDNIENDNFVFGDTKKQTKDLEGENDETEIKEKPVCHIEKVPIIDNNVSPQPSTKVTSTVPIVSPTITATAPAPAVHIGEPVIPKVPATPAVPKNPVIESPEDLEKWLDDFLDG